MICVNMQLYIVPHPSTTYCWQEHQKAYVRSFGGRSAKGFTLRCTWFANSVQGTKLQPLEAPCWDIPSAGSRTCGVQETVSRRGFWLIITSAPPWYFRCSAVNLWRGNGGNGKNPVSTRSSFQDPMLITKHLWVWSTHVEAQIGLHLSAGTGPSKLLLFAGGHSEVKNTAKTCCHNPGFMDQPGRQKVPSVWSYWKQQVQSIDTTSPQPSRNPRLTRQLDAIMTGKLKARPSHGNTCPNQPHCWELSRASALHIKRCSACGGRAFRNNGSFLWSNGANQYQSGGEQATGGRGKKKTLPP